MECCRRQGGAVPRALVRRARMGWRFGFAFRRLGCQCEMGRRARHRFRQVLVSPADFPSPWITDCRVALPARKAQPPGALLAHDHLSKMRHGWGRQCRRPVPVRWRVRAPEYRAVGGRRDTFSGMRQPSRSEDLPTPAAADSRSSRRCSVRDGSSMWWGRGKCWA
jgi:hypothetical protein